MPTHRIPTVPRRARRESRSDPSIAPRRAAQNETPHFGPSGFAALTLERLRGAVYNRDIRGLVWASLGFRLSSAGGSPSGATTGDAEGVRKEDVMSIGRVTDPVDLIQALGGRSCLIHPIVFAMQRLDA